MKKQISNPAFQNNEECALALFNYLYKTGAIEGSEDDRIAILHDINNLRGREWLDIVERNLKTKPFFDYIGGAEFTEDEFIFDRGVSPDVFLKAVFNREFSENTSFLQVRDLLDQNGFQDLWDFSVDDLDEAVANLDDDKWLLAVSFYEDNGYFVRVFEVTDEIARRFERVLANENDYNNSAPKHSSLSKHQIFGFSEISSEGYAGGNESRTWLFGSRQECIDAAYESYCSAWKEFEESGLIENGLDENENGILSREEFSSKMHYNKYVFILLPDSLVAFELFEQEVELEATQQISNDRLSTLLHNSIICLEEYGCDGAQLEADIGITSEEYDVVMDDNTSYESEPTKHVKEEGIPVVQNLINAVVAYAGDNLWTDNDMLDALTSLGVAYEDFCHAGMGAFVESYFFDESAKEEALKSEDKPSYAPWREFSLSRKECDDFVDKMISTIRGMGIDEGSGYYGLKSFSLGDEQFNLYCEISKEQEDGDIYYTVYYAVEYDGGDTIFSDWRHTEIMDSEELKNIVFEIASNDYTQSVKDYIEKANNDRPSLSSQIESASSRAAGVNDSENHCNHIDDRTGHGL